LGLGLGFDEGAQAEELRGDEMVEHEPTLEDSRAYIGIHGYQVRVGMARAWRGASQSNIRIDFPVCPQ
jgi:hypothetical protein